MPVWCHMFQQTLDGAAGGWFDRLEPGSIDSWEELREQFSARFSLQGKCTKDPTEITKIVWRAHESLPDFKERWTDEASYISGVPDIMKISAFMNAHRCPALAKKFSDRIPRTITKMFTRVDDFARSEEAYRNTELPRGEAFESSRKGFVPRNNEIHGKGGNGDRSRGGHRGDRRQKDAFHPYVSLRNNRDNYRNDHNRRDAPRHIAYRPDLGALTKPPREILATGSRPRKENADKFYEYHKEHRHLTNHCRELKNQLEVALESGKLDHLLREWK